jgi:hypothetical protein
MSHFDSSAWNSFDKTAKDAKRRRQDSFGALGVRLGVLGGKKAVRCR